MQKVTSKNIYSCDTNELVTNNSKYHHITIQMKGMICSLCGHKISQHVSYYDKGFKTICPDQKIIIDKQYNVIQIIPPELYNKYYSSDHTKLIIDKLLNEYEHSDTEQYEEKLLTILQYILTEVLNGKNH